MKIRTRIERKLADEIDVEVPLYLTTSDVFDAGGGYFAEHRIGADGMMVSLKQTSYRQGHEEWEIEAEKIDLYRELGQYTVGHYFRPSTAEAFAKQAAALFDYLGKAKLT